MSPEDKGGVRSEEPAAIDPPAADPPAADPPPADSPAAEKAPPSRDVGENADHKRRLELLEAGHAEAHDALEALKARWRAEDEATAAERKLVVEAHEQGAKDRDAMRVQLGGEPIAVTEQRATEKAAADRLAKAEAEQAALAAANAKKEEHAATERKAAEAAEAARVAHEAEAKRAAQLAEERADIAREDETEKQRTAEAQRAQQAQAQRVEQQAEQQRAADAAKGGKPAEPQGKSP